jgi:enterochelin esterase-like enzyme
MRLPKSRLVVLLFTLAAAAAGSDQPSVPALIERQAKAMAPLWADGDTLTFFHRGEAERVSVLFGGDLQQLRRLPDSDVWVLSLQRPRLQEAVLSYAILPHRADEDPLRGRPFAFKTWRGSKAPPAPERADPLKGVVRTVEFDSQSLVAKRRVRVYLPPDFDRARSCPTVYATDGRDVAPVLEPLITSGKVPPLVVVAAASGGYLGGPGGHDPKKDLRAMEYLPGIDDDRFARHEKFFCEELAAWAEREFGASATRGKRAVFGTSNGGRFAVEMGLRHPDRFGHVFAFSVAGRRELKPLGRAEQPPHFHLAAGIWEGPFLQITREVADALSRKGIPSTLTTRVGGHDPILWEEELAAAVERAFAKG